MAIKTSIFIFIFLSFPFFAYGFVIISEVAWMGTKNSPNDEWIELYNNGDDIDLNGWILKADDGNPEIKLNGTIPANGFYLLERTDDKSSPDKIANLIYTGSLNNSGENLRLFNSSGEIVDEILCQDGWTGGDNETKETFKRTNNIEVQLPYIEPSPELSEVGPRRIYQKGIVFNEILPSPEGADSENEWIELYNQNDYEIDLSGWIVKDTAGSPKNYTLNSRIPSYGYLLLKRPETGITLNNDGDGLVLINPDGEIVDSVNFGKANQNESYIKISSGWVWTTILTPEDKNIVTKKIAEEKKPELTEKNTAEETEKTKTIKLVDDLNKTPKNHFFTAFIIAVLSGVSFLIIKNNLKVF